MSKLQAAAATFAAKTRHLGHDHPATIGAHQSLVEVQIENAIERALADAPRLTSEQVNRLTGMLRAGTTTGAQS